MKKFAHLDINIVTHCNNRCVACSHASPFTKAYYMSPEVVAKDLESLKPFLSFVRVQLVGGEPTLHPQLTEIIKVAKQSGVGDKVSIITNGRLLPKMRDEFWKAIDIVQVSVYQNLKPEVLEQSRMMAQSFGVPFYTAVFDQFYLQFRKEPDEGSSFYDCPWKTDCYTIHEGHFYLCPQSTFFPSLFQGLAANVDGLPLEGLTEEKLEAFLNRKNPFNACKICCGGHIKTTPWREAKNLEEWIRDSTV